VQKRLLVDVLKKIASRGLRFEKKSGVPRLGYRHYFHCAPKCFHLWWL